MNRRTFLALAGATAATAATLPRATLAQAKLPRVAFLSPPLTQETWDTIVAALAAAGYVDGKTMTLDRFTAATSADLPAFGARALAANPDVLMTVGTAATLAAKSLTTTVAIVFQSNAPVELGLVTSLAHPGGNLTGISNTAPDLAGKQLGILKEALPGVRRVAVLNFGVGPGVQIVTDALLAAAPALGLEAAVFDFVEGKDFAEQFQRVPLSGAEAVYVPNSTYFIANRDLLFDLELKTRLPQFWGPYAQPFDGLLAYDPNTPAQYRRMGVMVDAILKGVKPADIPVEQPTVFDFVVNLRTARALGITIPTSILVQATQVIE
jgi:putative ABC transport system substrate-binding protein